MESPIIRGRNECLRLAKESLFDIVILGGGIMKRRFLFGAIRKKVLEALNGYVQCAAILEQIDDYIVPPALGSESGVLGAVALAARIVP